MSVVALTLMVLLPGCTEVGWVSAMVSSSEVGFGVDDDRIWIWVPVLVTST